jgi:hypothetical protein
VIGNATPYTCHGKFSLISLLACTGFANVATTIDDRKRLRNRIEGIGVIIQSDPPFGLQHKIEKENPCLRRQLNIIRRLRSIADKPRVNMSKQRSSTRPVSMRKPLITPIQRVATSNSHGLTPTRRPWLTSRSTAGRVRPLSQRQAGELFEEKSPAIVGLFATLNSG